MTYKQHQIQASDQVYDIVKSKGICLLAGLPRTGKTRTAIRVAELSKCEHVLVVTRKNAIPGWRKELRAVTATKRYTVTNYEQVAKLTGSYDLAIVDESHNIGRPGKPTQRLQDLRKKVYGLPIILLTGTPAAETLLSYYYQFCLSPKSPFAEYKNFYAFFKDYGEPRQIYVNGRMQETYTKGRPEILAKVKPYIVTLTQEQAGIIHKAQDHVHVVKLNDDTKAMIDAIRTDQVIEIDRETVAFESDMAERAAVHQVECGALKVNGRVSLLPNSEVVDYLYATFGDKDDVGFMCHYVSTRQKLMQRFKKAKLFSSQSHAEGVDLSHLKHFVIVNSGYSGASFIQRRDRIVNINRDTPAVVHHITTDGGISAQVYTTLKNKKDFTLRLYRNARTDLTESHHPIP